MEKCGRKRLFKIQQFIKIVFLKKLLKIFFSGKGKGSQDCKTIMENEQGSKLLS